MLRRDNGATSTSPSQDQEGQNEVEKRVVVDEKKVYKNERNTREVDVVWVSSE